MAKETRKVVGKDDYDNPVYEGQVKVQDAHGNEVYRDPDIGTGPAHLKEKHQGKAGARNTGRIDEHGNEIWESGSTD